MTWKYRSEIDVRTTLWETGDGDLPVQLKLLESPGADSARSHDNATSDDERGSNESGHNQVRSMYSIVSHVHDGPMMQPNHEKQDASRYLQNTTPNFNQIQHYHCNLDVVCS
jgi:hypothetical protein